MSGERGERAATTARADSVRPKTTAASLSYLAEHDLHLDRVAAVDRQAARHRVRAPLVEVCPERRCGRAHSHNARGSLGAA